MFPTFGEKLKEAEKHYDNKDYHSVILECAKLIEHAVSYLFKNFHMTLESNEERTRFLEFEKRNAENYILFLEKPTIGIAIGFINTLTDSFKKHSWIKPEYMPYLNTINNIRNAQLHSGKDLATDNDAGNIIDSAEHFLNETGLVKKAVDTTGFPLKYFLVYSSINNKFQQAETENDFRRIINDSSKLIPDLLENILNKAYPLTTIENKEKLNIFFSKTIRQKSQKTLIKQYIEIFDEIKLFNQVENGENLRDSLKVIF